jgi:hypothetical protein
MEIAVKTWILELLSAMALASFEQDTLAKAVEARAKWHVHSGDT